MNNSKGGMIVNDEMTLDDYNRLILQQYLKKYENNISIVANKLNIGRSTVYRILKREQ
jgi:transcriptional regulator with PAS, ATPase and Fis domain